MRRKKNKEKSKEADKKGAERMKHFENLKEKPVRKKKEVDIVDDGMTCQIYWQKSVVNGDDDWCERFYYYTKKKDKRGGKAGEMYGPGEKQ